MPVPAYLLERKEQEIQEALRRLLALPPLTRSDCGDEDACPICLLPFSTIFEDEESLNEKQEGSSDLSSDNTRMTGVVKLSVCGHIFCRKDLAEWIESHHGNCPTCRRTFFAFTQIDEADYESSDGGEYIPEEDEEDYDEYTDGEFDIAASSDIDYEMYEAEFGDEEEGDEPGYSLLTQDPDDVAVAHLRPSSAESVPQLREDFWAHGTLDERRFPDADIELGLEDFHDDVDGLSYGSDSPSEGLPSNNEDNLEGASATDIRIVEDNELTCEACENKESLPIGIGQTTAKFPGMEDSCAANSNHSITP